MNSLDNDLLAGNMPPQDISAEKAILGAVFLNPEALADVMEQVEPDDFYSRQHQILFQSMIELNDDMVSIKKETLKVMTPKGGTLKDYAYREAPYVFYRQGLYYFLWSVDDTGSANYHVAYGTSDSPLGSIKVAKDPVVMIQDPSKEIYGTAHNSVVRKPGTDEWYIVYHRINKNYLDKDKAPGVHREVCIDRMEFNADGTIQRVKVSK